MNLGIAATLGSAIRSMPNRGQQQSGSASNLRAFGARPMSTRGAAVIRRGSRGYPEARPRVGWRDGRNLLSPPPLSRGDHPACGLALSALHAELSRRQGTSRSARARHLLRDRPVLGVEIRTGDRATATPLSFAAELSLAPRRDGGADRRRADVLVARRRSRGRGSRYAGSAPARYSGGAAADAQAAQEARLCAEIAGHRQAALLRLRIPASATDLPA